MIDNDFIYNDEYIVILPKYDDKYLSAFEYTFKNIFVFDDKKSINKQINIIKKSNYKQIIFVDYLTNYTEVIRALGKGKIYKIIFTKSLGSLSSEKHYIIFNSVMNLFNEYKMSKLGFIDNNLYNSFKDKINCSPVSLDIKQEKNEISYDKKRIGILNDEENPMHSFYNELSALSFNDYKAVLLNKNKTTTDFLKLFNIKSLKSNNNISGNLVNLYINFTDSDETTFIKSMDLGVPCILGNNEIIKGTNLEKYLFVESDDSVDEIRDKIELVKENRNIILKEYKIFREEYSKKCIKEKEEFLEYKEESIKEKEYDLLLSIVVPVWNTEKYLKTSLNSIIKSIPKELNNKFEMLIISDGSPDNSEKIIKEYEKKYKFIRYIYQENHGLGSVRNLALKNARGKYIASVDSDDTVNKNFFKEVYKAIEKDADVFICDWLSITNSEKYITSAIEDNIFNNLSKYEGLLYSSIMPSTCNKVFKKSLFDDLKINYYDGKFEDLSTNPFVLLKAKKIIYLNKPYYEYYIRSNTLNRSKPGLSMVHVLKLFYERLEKYKKYCNLNIELFKYYTISWRMESYIFNQLYDMDVKERKEILKYIYDNFYDEVIDMFSNKYYQDMISKLNNDKKKYIVKRTEAFKNKKMESILDDKDKFELNAPIIYFGDK